MKTSYFQGFQVGIDGLTNDDCIGRKELPELLLNISWCFGNTTKKLFGNTRETGQVVKDGHVRLDEGVIDCL